MMTSCRLVLRVLLLVAMLHPASASALSRAAVPLSVAIAQADAIVVARTKKVPANPFSEDAQHAEIEIERSLKGNLPNGGLSVRLDRLHAMAIGPLQQDKEYLIFLNSPVGAPATLQIMLDGTKLFNNETAIQVKAMVEMTPAWAPAKNGLSTCLVAEKYRVKGDEDLDLFVCCKNESDHKITFKHSDWPLATHTHWTLEVALEGGAKISAAKHPSLTPAEINDYFSKFPRTYEVTLEPGQQSYFAMQRVNSAKPGWGHKQDLDFSYYPMTQPGTYLISAQSHHLGATVVAQGLRIRLE